MIGSLFRHVPNLLTFLRIGAVPVFIVLMLRGRLTQAAWVFVAAEATDVLDGFIARKFNFITPLGRWLDPLADKLMLLSALFMLSQRGMIFWILPWLVLCKELFLVISGILLIRRRTRHDLSARWFGKATSVLFFIAIALTFVGIPEWLSESLLWLSLGMALFAALMYSLSYMRHRKAMEEK